MFLLYTFIISGDGYTTSLWSILCYGSMFFLICIFTITGDGYTTILWPILCYGFSFNNGRHHECMLSRLSQLFQLSVW